MDDIENEMKICFLEEGTQLLEEAEGCFLELENNRDSMPTIEKLFRIAHNIKGTSRAVGFADVAEFTHQFENLLLELKDGRRHVDQPCVDMMLECNDAVKHMIEALAGNLQATFDNSALVAKLKAYMATPQGAEDAAADAVTPDAADFEGVPDASANEWAEPTSDLVSDAAPEAAAPQLHVVPSVEAGKMPVAPPTASAATATDKQAAAGPDESIRVSLKRLERLSDYIGELVILQTVLDQHASESESILVSRTISQLGKLSKEIQDISLSLRMIPLKQTFAKLQRIIRDTGRTLGKEVDLVIEGDQTEVDKTVLENLSDPLVHIVRNAIDHGLETTDDRLKAGKSKQGSIQIKAFHKGNNLVIEVKDDGKGVDPSRLRQKAIEKGLIRADARMTDDESMQLLFRAGFSTKDQVSEISGRGVGLDVVKTNVEKMGGSVTLESTLGAGSTFRITLPLTLAIIEGLICEVSGERVVIPMANVREIVRSKEGDIKEGAGGKMLNLRGKVLPVFDLSAMLGLKQDGLRKPVILISESRSGQFGVTIDEIVRQQQIVIKKLGQELVGRKGFVGSAILGDGKPSLILDMGDLVESNQNARGKSGARLAV